MNITEYALNNRALIKFFIAVLVVGGMFAFVSMSKLEDPELKVKQAMVVTVYPGASAHKVELEVTDVLEKSIRSMGEVDNIQSKSMADVSQITVELSSTVKPDELEQKWDMLRRKVANAQAELPSGAVASVVMDDFGDVYGMFYAMTTDGIADEELLDYAWLVKRELQDIEGVRRVEIYGDRKPCINIEIIHDRMANMENAIHHISESLEEPSELSVEEAMEQENQQAAVLGQDMSEEASNNKEESEKNPAAEEKEEETDEAVTEEPVKETSEEQTEEVQEVISQAVREPEKYRVQTGDTLLEICRARYGDEKMVKQVCEMNDLEDGDMIYVGEIILLP